jgi:hypothetical protein
MRAAVTGVPKVLGSSFRETQPSPKSPACVQARAGFFARQFEPPNSVELWGMRARHVDELVGQSVITGMRGTHPPSRGLSHPT